METSEREKEPKPGEGGGKDKEFTIVVNARQKFVTQRELTFEQVVALAFDAPPAGGDLAFTVTYRRGEGNKPEGTLVAGESTRVKDGMIFDVTKTVRS